MGKLGAVVGAYAMPPILEAYSLEIVFMICCGVSYLGVFVSLFLVWDEPDEEYERINSNSTQHQKFIIHLQTKTGPVSAKEFMSYVAWSFHQSFACFVVTCWQRVSCKLPSQVGSSVQQ